MSGVRGTPEQRFWPKVNKTDTCWLWMAARNVHGYGQFYPAQGRALYAHRYAYQVMVGPIPEGLELDHLCREPACVRPDHLEAVTHRENLRRTAWFTRGTCPQGHPWNAENTYFGSNGRKCRICHREQARARYAAKRQQVKS